MGTLTIVAKCRVFRITFLSLCPKFGPFIHADGNEATPADL
jgi:hypothetical protein